MFKSRVLLLCISFLLVSAVPSYSAVKKPTSKTVVKKSVVKKIVVKPIQTKSPTVEPPKVVEPTPTPTPTAPAQPISFDNLDLIWTSKVARTEILTEFAKLKKPEGAYELFVGPTVASGDIAEEKRLLDIATTMFSEYFLPKKFQVVYFSERDANWAEETKTKIGAGYHTTFQAEIDKLPYRCDFAFATKGKDQTPAYFSCLDSKVSRGTMNASIPIHEYFHFVQQKYSWQKMPCWMLEGSATYFGAVLGIDKNDPTGKMSFEFTKRLAYQYGPEGQFNPGSLNQSNTRLIEKIVSEAGLLDLFIQLDKNMKELGNTSCTSLGAYAVGSIATEALIAVKGYKTYMDFVSTFPITADWKSEFKKAYGLSTDDFYLKLAPYLRYRITG